MLAAADAVTPTPTPTPVTTPPVTTPPPAAVSNAFTIASARVSGTTIRLSLQLPGAGKISVASSTKPKKGKHDQARRQDGHASRSPAPRRSR